MFVIILKVIGQQNSIIRQGLGIGKGREKWRKRGEERGGRGKEKVGEAEERRERKEVGEGGGEGRGGRKGKENRREGK